MRQIVTPSTDRNARHTHAFSLSFTKTSSFFCSLCSSVCVPLCLFLSLSFLFFRVYLSLSVFSNFLPVCRYRRSTLLPDASRYYRPTLLFDLATDFSLSKFQQSFRYKTSTAVSLGDLLQRGQSLIFPSIFSLISFLPH